MNARAQAAQRQDLAIQENVAQIEATKARPSAVDMMASRLNISPGKLMDTLKKTVFKGASDAELAALMVVANEYRLNPLTKEIYAFPIKGGGIVPIVSIDGWLRIINEHPQFDGLEHTDMHDADGNLYAIECSIYRKDRTRPIKIIEYLSECKQDTIPWKNLPNRMLRHKSTIQCGRYAFGFSGIDGEADSEMVNVTPIRDAGPAPSRGQIEQHDAETGEVFEREPEVDEDAEREAAMAADREVYAQHDGDPRDGDEVVQDVSGATDTRSTSERWRDQFCDEAAAVKTKAALKSLDTEIDKVRVVLDDEHAEEIDREVASARKRLG